MSYNPDLAAVALQQTERFTRFLSQRDLGVVVPVNFVTYPGVVLSAACFGHGRYEAVAGAKCFSNLLATGFRRIDADVFWDASQTHWSLCPFELGNADDVLSSSTSIATTLPQTSTSLRGGFITDRATAAASLDALTFDSVLKRQTPTLTSSVSSPSTSPVQAPTSSVASITPSGVIATNDFTTVQAGPYTCSKNTDLALLFNVVSGFLEDTEFMTNASAVTLTLHLHVAAPISNPTGSAVQPAGDNFSDTTSLLTAAIAPNASVYIYSPSELLEQRSDLNHNKSWFTVLTELRPDAAFFRVDNVNGRSFTPDGWPSESFIDFERDRRLLVSFGDIDPQLSAYNFTGDEAFIFPSGYLASPRTVTTTGQGRITSGCFFNPNDTSLASVNSSWAITTIGNGSLPTEEGYQNILAQASNLTYCGISPILNGTLNNLTADQDPSSYTGFIQETIWSWAAGQPINASSSPELHDYHCAAMNSTSGRWQASDCGEARRGACRIGSGPYTWQVSNADASYGKIDLACDDGTAFDVPRSSLENTYLLSVWRTWQTDHDDDESGSLLWMNFNDLAVSGCWVVGQNTTCPYNGPPSTATREIVVPVVGGIVVFALAGLTVLVKVAGNRQQAKRRRRRGDDGWDYEGVPS